MADTKKTTKAVLKSTKTTAKKATEVKTLAQLQEELLTLRNDHQESRRSHRMGELVNPHVLTVQRKGIARSLTAINKAQAQEVLSDKELSTKEEN